MTKLLCVYCASSDRLDPKYYDAAAELGGAMVAHGWGLVYGGGKTGVMGAVARAVKQAGGRVVGMIPEFMKAVKHGAVPRGDHRAADLRGDRSRGRRTGGREVV